jgi:hypothetical protein
MNKTEVIILNSLFIDGVMHLNSREAVIAALKISRYCKTIYMDSDQIINSNVFSVVHDHEHNPNTRFAGNQLAIEALAKEIYNITEKDLIVDGIEVKWGE